MAKFAKKRVESRDPKVENIRNARIRVGATRAPQITGVEEVAQSPLGELFDALGEFAEGPFSQSLRAAHYEKVKGRAEKAVLEGTTLDEVEDKDFVFEHYYRGARGKQLGSEILANIQAAYDQNADDDTFDHKQAVHGIVADGLRDLDHTTSTNAAAILQRHLQGVVDLESDRRTTKARNDALLLGQEATTGETDVLFKARDFGAALDQYEAGRADAKELKGPFDAKRYQEYIASDIIAAIKNPVNDYTPEEIVEFQQAVEAHTAPSGAKLWTSPIVGKRLKAAFAVALREKSVKQTLEQKRQAKRLQDAAKDMETLPAEHQIIAMEQAGQLTTDQAATILHTRENTIEYDREELANAAAISMPEKFGATDTSLGEVLDDQKLFEGATRRMVTEAEDAGVDPSRARIETATIVAQKHGRTIPWLDNEMRAKVRQGDYKAGSAYYSALEAENPMLAVQFGSASERAAVKFWRTMSSATDTATAEKLTNLGFENYQAGDGAILSLIKEGTFDGLLMREDVHGDAAMRQRIRERAAFLTATGQDPTNATLEAARLEQAETFRDEHDIPMTSDANNPLWAIDDVRDRVRSDFLQPWLERRGIDTDNLFSRDEEFQARIRPLRDGQALVETPEGIVLGVVPLATWAHRANTTMHDEAAAEVQAENIAADEARAATRKPRKFGRPLSNR